MHSESARDFLFETGLFEQFGSDRSLRKSELGRHC
jgi:hypothetical protein